MNNDNLYERENANNQEQFYNQLKLFRPEIHALSVAIDEFKVNPLVLLKIIRGLNMIAAGGVGWGNVTVEIQQNKVLFVKTTEAERLDEPISTSQEEQNYV